MIGIVVGTFVGTVAAIALIEWWRLRKQRAARAKKASKA